MQTTSKIWHALRDGDLQFIMGYVEGRFGVEISKAAARRLHELAVAQKLSNSWSDCSTNMWIKNRITFGCDHGSEKGLGLPGCELNTFFLHLEETPEMLVNLTADEPDEPVDYSHVARSKISGTQLAEIRAIDRTAANVLPPE